MLQRHSVEEQENARKGESENALGMPKRMTLLEHPIEQERTELEPYWGYEPPSKPESEKNDPLSEQNVAIWLGIMVIIGVTALVVYYLWARLP